jgi:hypothetical protein
MKQDRDKFRLVHLGLSIVGMVFPGMETPEGQKVLDWFSLEIMKLVKELKKRAEAL